MMPITQDCIDDMNAKATMLHITASAKEVQLFKELCARRDPNAIYDYAMTPFVIATLTGAGKAAFNDAKKPMGIHRGLEMAAKGLINDDVSLIWNEIDAIAGLAMGRMLESFDMDFRWVMPEKGQRDSIDIHADGALQKAKKMGNIPLRHFTYFAMQGEDEGDPAKGENNLCTLAIRDTHDVRQALAKYGVKNRAKGLGVIAYDIPEKSRAAFEAELPPGSIVHLPANSLAVMFQMCTLHATSVSISQHPRQRSFARGFMYNLPGVS